VLPWSPLSIAAFPTLVGGVLQRKQIFVLRSVEKRYRQMSHVTCCAGSRRQAETSTVNGVPEDQGTLSLRDGTDRLRVGTSNASTRPVRNWDGAMKYHGLSIMLILISNG
jgi:hypothetical protein